MFSFKRKAEKPQVEPTKQAAPAGMLQRLKQGLSKTRAAFSLGLFEWGKKSIDGDLYQTIETRLLLADVGLPTTESIMQELTQAVQRKQLMQGDALLQALQQLLIRRLQAVTEPPLTIIAPGQLWLMVGVNGAGKTTTMGKLAHYYKNEGQQLLLAAGDTFRAAAVEQLCRWGERFSVPVVKQNTGADSASVIFDAYQSVKARGLDLCLADTAGRLHTQDHLMRELEKITRVVKKIDEKAPHEVLLVLDATIGQNALQQAKAFQACVGVTGLVVTKLDGTAKGGIVFAIAEELQLPIRFMGVGEGPDDLRPFVGEDFVSALFEE